MAGYKTPTFEDRPPWPRRPARALKLANKPVVDEETMAKRKAAQEAREAEAPKRAPPSAPRAQAKAEKAAATKAAEPLPYRSRPRQN